MAFTRDNHLLYEYNLLKDQSEVMTDTIPYHKGVSYKPFHQSPAHLSQDSYTAKVCQEIIFQNKMLETMILPKKYEIKIKKKCKIISPTSNPTIRLRTPNSSGINITQYV